MTVVLLLALAAASGTALRAELVLRGSERGRAHVGTLAVNLIGCSLAGLLAGTSGATHTVLVVGGLGALTTFSGFARDVVRLVEHGRPGLALAYAIASCAGGVGAAAAGVALAP